MGWTTPSTWAANLLLSALKFNEQIRDNQNYLFSGFALKQTVYSGASNPAVTGTTWTTIDATNVKLTMTVKSGRAIVEATFSAQNASNAVGTFDLIVDGTTRSSSAGLYAIPQGVTQVQCVKLVGIFEGLSVGSHDFNIQYKNADAGGHAVTVYNNGVPITLVGWAK